MGSSFLTTIYVLLSLYCCIAFLKLIIQFGLPNHPARFTLYLVSMCATAYFLMQALAGVGLMSPIDFLRWRVLPLVAGGLALLLQVISTQGQFSLIQQKVISRLPLIAALLVFAFFQAYANGFLVLCLVAGLVFLTVSVGKARYQKRMYVKMILFLGLFAAGTFSNSFWIYVVASCCLFPALFYFFIFEKTFGVSALVEEHQSEGPGVPT